MSKPRILIFSTAYLPFVGGAEVAIKEITDRLGDKYEFEMLTARLDSKLPKKERIGNVLVHRFGDKLTLALFGVFKIFALGKSRFGLPNRGSSISQAKSGFDLFWSVQASYASGPAYIYNILKFWQKVPIVLTLQEGDSEEHLTKRHFGLINLSWKLAVPRSTKITVLSNYLAERAVKYGALTKPEIIPNGVAEDFFREQWKGRDGKTIVTTSRLVHKNAVDILIQAMTELPDSALWIAGEGPLRSDLESQVLRSDLGIRVKFLGTVSRADLPKLLASSDIFVRTSRSEGLGVSFLEAMAAGIPVIATPVGGITDFLRDRETGLFCKVDDPKDLAEKVKELAGNEDLREKVVRNARELIREKYTWEKVSEQMNYVFTKA